MPRQPKDPLRELSEKERNELEHISRASSMPAVQVIRAKLILAVANGMSYINAARSVGRRSDEAVSQLVNRFNREGMEALVPRQGGGPKPTYGEAEKARILAEVKRQPERETDGTATWSLSLLQRRLRAAPDGLPKVSTYTIQQVLHEGGWSWQRDQSWCETGTVLRKRQGEIVAVTDPAMEAKKLD